MTARRHSAHLHFAVYFGGNDHFVAVGEIFQSASENLLTVPME